MPWRRNELVTCKHPDCGKRFTWSKLKRVVICPFCDTDNAGPEHYGSVRRDQKQEMTKEREKGVKVA